MAANIINRLSNAINNIEQAIGRVLSQRFPPGGSIGAFAHDFDGSASLPDGINKSTKAFSLKDIVGDGFLWGVPKVRRPIEKKMNRRFGHPEYNWKLLVPKTHLVMCPNCGHDYEVTNLCAHCYAKIREETKEMQQVIKKTLGIEPVEKEVVVIYENDNEKENKDAEFWKSQRIVEMRKKRPDWFHSNLTQSTTQQPSDSKEVEPTGLA